MRTITEVQELLKEINNCQGIETEDVDLDIIKEMAITPN